MAKFFVRVKGDTIALHVKVGGVVIAHGIATRDKGWPGLKEHAHARLAAVRGVQLKLLETGQVNAKQEVTNERG